MIEGKRAFGSVQCDISNTTFVSTRNKRWIQKSVHATGAHLSTSVTCHQMGDKGHTYWFL